jgi:hypothetical protein
MSLNQLIDPVKALDVDVNNILCEGDIQVANALNVSGNTNMDGSLTILGQFTQGDNVGVQDAEFKNSVDVKGDLNVDGKITGGGFSNPVQKTLSASGGSFEVDVNCQSFNINLDSVLLEQLPDTDIGGGIKKATYRYCCNTSDIETTALLVLTREGQLGIKLKDSLIPANPILLKATCNIAGDVVNSATASIATSNAFLSCNPTQNVAGEIELVFIQGSSTYIVSKNYKLNFDIIFHLP